jgi:hypothetical protein
VVLRDVLHKPRNTKIAAVIHAVLSQYSHCVFGGDGLNVTGRPNIFPLFSISLACRTQHGCCPVGKLQMNTAGMAAVSVASTITILQL